MILVQFKKFLLRLDFLLIPVYCIPMKFTFLILALLLSIPCLASPKAHRMIRIAVLDTGLDLNDPRFKGHLCRSGHLNFVTREDMSDSIGHGTFVVGLIQKYAGKANYCMAIYKYYEEGASDTVNDVREVLAMRAAIQGGANIINLSGGGPGFDEEEALLIKNNPKVLFIVAAGNEGTNVDIPGHEFYPASLPYTNIIPIGGIDSNGDRMLESNYGRRIKYKEIGRDVESTLPNGQTGFKSGTSMSTAIFSGKFIDRLSKLWND